MKLENSVPALGKVSDRGGKVCNNRSQGISNSKKEFTVIGVSCMMLFVLIILTII